MTLGISTLRLRGAPWIGAACLVASLPGLVVAPQVFFAAWLAGCWFALDVVLGALSWLWTHRLTGGTWGAVLRPHVLRLADRLPLVLLLFLPLAFGLSSLYPSLGGPAPISATSPAGRAFLHAWNEPALFAARCIVYALIWLALARGAHRPLKSGAAAAALMLHLVVTSLASVDLLAALVPGWSSSIFGLIALAGQMFGGGAYAVALACRDLRVAGSQPINDGVPLSRDYGNLLLTATLTWAYLAFMQLLIIWAENLPREISWYVPRLQSGWLFAGAALVALHLALPLALLLFRGIKDSPRRLELLALAMVGAHALDVAWLVMPSVAPHDLAAWWLLPLVTTGISLVAFAQVDASLQPAAAAAATEVADARP